MGNLPGNGIRLIQRVRQNNGACSAAVSCSKSFTKISSCCKGFSLSNGIRILDMGCGLGLAQKLMHHVTVIAREQNIDFYYIIHTSNDHWIRSVKSDLPSVFTPHYSISSFNEA